LVSAVVTAGPTATLKGSGQFAVLAPTYTAFSAITVPTNGNILGNILKHHVISGKILSSSLPISYPVGCLTNRPMAKNNLCFSLIEFFFPVLLNVV
jgi:uncharacterized surface protein with fasciclin (FAS1) repeats